jgi:predicted house-cleaning NTP pyrophosphatase (Maf/HAM1 superfamily)
MEEQNLIQKVISTSPNRRSLLKKIGVATAAMAASGSLERELRGQTTPAPSDVVNFALNLESPATSANLS